MVTDYALRYARAVKKRAPQSPQEPRTGAGEGVGQGSLEAFSQGEREQFEERAAMVEHDAGYPRAEAELVAVASAIPQASPLAKLGDLEAWIWIKEQVRAMLTRHVEAGDPLGKDAGNALRGVEAELVEARALLEERRTGEGE